MRNKNPSPDIFICSDCHLEFAGDIVSPVTTCPECHQETPTVYMLRSGSDLAHDYVTKNRISLRQHESVCQFRGDRKQTLNLWTVYYSTLDFPGKYVARRFELDKPTHDHFASDDIESVRSWIKQQATKHPQGMPYRMNRQSGDDPAIVEVWV